MRRLDPTVAEGEVKIIYYQEDQCVMGITRILVIWTCEITIIGSNGWTMDDQTKLMRMAAGREIEPVIDSTLPMSRIGEGASETDRPQFLRQDRPDAMHNPLTRPRASASGHAPAAYNIADSRPVRRTRRTATVRPCRTTPPASSCPPIPAWPRTSSAGSSPGDGAMPSTSAPWSYAPPPPSATISAGARATCCGGCASAGRGCRSTVRCRSACPQNGCVLR